MSLFGYLAARELGDLVKRELDGPPDRGDGYLLPDELARQRACAQLAADPSVDADGIEVSVLSGVLRLSGSVPDEGMRARAEEIGRAVVGVGQVENALVVR